MSKLDEITVLGKQVSIFKPPHDEPDFPWVDLAELASAFYPESEIDHIVEMTKMFGEGQRAYATARNGDKIAMIVCHAMAQGLCGLVDFTNGQGKEDPGPAHQVYSLAFAKFAADNYPMSFEEIFHAFRNSGGKFLAEVRGDA